MPARPAPRPESPDAGLALDAAPDAAPDARPVAIAPSAPFVAHVVSVSIQVDASKVETAVVTIDAGVRRGIAANWRATVLRGDSDVALDGGTIDVVRVGARITIGRARLAPDQIAANRRVRFDPPGP